MPPAKEDSKRQCRRFRARPLYLSEPVPVYYFTPEVRKRQSELYRWLLSEEGKRRDQVQVLDDEGRAIRVEPWSDTPTKTEINVPTWKSTERRSGVQSRLPQTEPPFHRHTATPLEHARYIADDDDDEWLSKAHVGYDELVRSE